MTIMQKLFGFQGRLRRRDWWLLSLSIAVLQTLVAQAATVAVYGADASLLHGRQPDLEVFGQRLIMFGAGLLFLWPSLALGVKRFHDRAKPAWPIYAVSALFLAAGLLPNRWGAAGPGLGALAIALDLLELGLGLWLFVALGLMDGDPADNAYGPPPKARPAGPVPSREISS